MTFKLTDLRTLNLIHQQQTPENTAVKATELAVSNPRVAKQGRPTAWK